MTDASRWNELVDGSPDAYFSQLWEWGEIQRSIGWEPSRLELWSPGSAERGPVAATQVLVRRLPASDWGVAHAPRGPVLGRDRPDWARLKGALVAWARENRIATLIFDPDVGPETDLGDALMRPPWRAAPGLGEPRCHVVDLRSPSELWSNVRRKHREWIRRAERADVDIRWTDHGSSDADAELAIGQFQQVYAEIAERIGVPIQEPAYYRLMWGTFRGAGRAQLVTASVDGTPAGAMLHIMCGDIMLWFAGGQAAAGESLGIGKLLIWRSMVRATELGSGRYNMWGTATEGLAHFKMGFGAREESYVGTRSMAVNRPIDALVRAAWQARQLRRRLLKR